MDTILYSVLRITVMILILRTLFRLFAYPKSKMFRFNVKQRDEDKTAEKNPSQEAHNKAVPAEMVVDTVHGAKIPKHQAYILLDTDDNPVYFSTWDDRQAYILKSI